MTLQPWLSQCNLYSKNSHDFGYCCCLQTHLFLANVLCFEVAKLETCGVFGFSIKFHIAFQQFVGRNSKILINFCLCLGVPTVLVPSQTQTALFGTNVTLQCNVSAIPAHSLVYWQKTVIGSIVFIFPGNSSSQYSGMSPIAPALHISTVDFSDEANYSCFATNIVGTGQSLDVELDVTGSECFCVDKNHKDGVSIWFIPFV